MRLTLKFSKTGLPESVKGPRKEIPVVLRTHCWVLTCVWHHAKYFPFMAFKSHDCKRWALLISFRNRTWKLREVKFLV